MSRPDAPCERRQDTPERTPDPFEGVDSVRRYRYFASQAWTSW